MIKALLCSLSKVTTVEMWEEDPTVINQHIGIKAEEVYPFPDRDIAMICKPEGSEYEDTWQILGVGPAYGPLLFVHANPFSPEYESLSDEEITFLENVVRIQERGLEL